MRGERSAVRVSASWVATWVDLRRRVTALAEEVEASESESEEAEPLSESSSAVRLFNPGLKEKEPEDVSTVYESVEGFLAHWRLVIRRQSQLDVVTMPV